MVILLAIVGCTPIDPRECGYADDCAPWRPAGALSGLTHVADVADQQTGTSSRGVDGQVYDPGHHARADSTTPISNQPEAATPCPPELAPVDVLDEEANGIGWATCLHRGDRTAPSHPADVPQGATCGLGRFGYPDAACGDAVTAPGAPMACPAGFELRWVPDLFWNAVDATCRSDDSAEGQPPGSFIPLGLVQYCVATSEAFCSAGTCREDTLSEGFVCGLHARYAFLGTGAPRELVEDLDRLFTHCPEHPARPHEPALREAAEAPVTCLGVDVLAAGCPPPLVEQCTWDQVTASVWPEYAAVGNIAGEAWCWCASPELAQGVAPPLARSDE